MTTRSTKKQCCCEKLGHHESDNTKCWLHIQSGGRKIFPLRLAVTTIQTNNAQPGQIKIITFYTVSWLQDLLSNTGCNFLPILLQWIPNRSWMLYFRTLHCLDDGFTLVHYHFTVEHQADHVLGSHWKCLPAIVSKIWRNFQLSCLFLRHCWHCYKCINYEEFQDFLWKYFSWIIFQSISFLHWLSLINETDNGRLQSKWDRIGAIVFNLQNILEPMSPCMLYVSNLHWNFVKLLNACKFGCQ